MKNIEFASQEQIEDFESIARQFFHTVLDLNYDECLVTDESRLSDFSSCGMPNELADAATDLKALYAAWDAWVIPQILHQYGLDEIEPSILLIDLFEQIYRQGLRSIQ